MSNLSKLNYINVGPDGTFQPSGIAAYDTKPADVDAIFADLEQSGQKKILLYFHGGLVNEQSGMDTAVTVTPLLTAAGVHPVSFIWETGFFETITQNLGSIGSTDFFKKILEKVIKVAGDKLGVQIPTDVGSRGVATMTYTEIQAELTKPAPFADYGEQEGARSINVISGNDRRLSDEIEVQVTKELMADPYFQQNPLANLSDEELTLIKKDQLVNEPAPGARGILSIAGLIKAAVTIIFKVVKRFIAKRDHNFYPTVVEEILREVYIADFGAWLWGDMKTKAAQMWQTDNTVADPLAQHAGGYFLKKLKAFAENKTDITIDLVGHSAGAIVICHFVEAFYQLQVNARITHTTFLAPACRSDLFYDKIVKDQVDIGCFRMFTMNDHYECLDYCLKYVYTHSLLYLISGVLEPNEYDAYILGMERYLSGAAPYDQDPKLDAIRQYMAAKPNRTVFAVTADGALSGLQCIAEHHGGFADPAVLAIGSIAYLLTQSDCDA